MLHLHALAALKPALSYYFSDEGQEAWLELNTTAQSPARALALWQELKSLQVELRPHAQAGLMKPPAIIAQLQGRRVTERPLGHTAAELEDCISELDAQLEIFTNGAEEAEALALTAWRALQQARGDFLKNGYIYLSLESISELEPHEAAAAEELGLFGRRITLRAQAHEAAARLGAWDELKGPLTLDIEHRGGRFNPTPMI